jgi:hypothetical protein
MTDLKKFKEKKPNTWELFGPASKVMAALFFLGDGLSKGQITKGLEGELDEQEVIKGIKYLQEQGELNFTENAQGRYYSLISKTREAFRDLYTTNL